MRANPKYHPYSSPFQPRSDGGCPGDGPLKAYGASTSHRPVMQTNPTQQSPAPQSNPSVPQQTRAPGSPSVARPQARFVSSAQQSRLDWHAAPSAHPRHLGHFFFFGFLAAVSRPATAPSSPPVRAPSPNPARRRVHPPNRCASIAVVSTRAIAGPAPPGDDPSHSTAPRHSDESAICARPTCDGIGNRRSLESAAGHAGGQRGDAETAPRAPLTPAALRQDAFQTRHPRPREMASPAYHLLY